MSNNQVSAKQLTSIKICQKCNDRPADSLNHMLCGICYRRIRFEQMGAEAQLREVLSIVPKKFIGAELSSLKPPLRNALSAKTESGVLLWGPTGVGKTYALSAMLKNRIAEGYNCQRVRYETLCLHLRDTFKSASRRSEWDIIEPLITCDVLVIEDIGTTKSIDSKETDFSLRTLYVLIDTRLEDCRPTYITTNKSVENITRSFDARIGDRLRLLNIIKLEGKSKR